MLDSLASRIRAELQEDYERDQEVLWREREPPARRQCLCLMCGRYFTPSVPWEDLAQPEDFCTDEHRSRYTENERLDAEYEAHEYEQQQREGYE